MRSALIDTYKSCAEFFVNYSDDLLILFDVAKYSVLMYNNFADKTTLRFEFVML